MSGASLASQRRHVFAFTMMAVNGWLTSCAIEARELPERRQPRHARQLGVRLLEFLLRCFLYADVHVGPDDANGSALFRRTDRPARQEPSDAAILVEHPVLHLVRRCLAVDGVLRARHDIRGIVGVHLPAPVVEVIPDLVILEPQHRFQGGVDVDVTGLEVPVPHPDIAGRRGQCMPFQAPLSAASACLRSVTSRTMLRTWSFLHGTMRAS